MRFPTIHFNSSQSAYRPIFGYFITRTMSSLFHFFSKLKLHYQRCATMHLAISIYICVIISLLNARMFLHTHCPGCIIGDNRVSPTRTAVAITRRDIHSARFKSPFRCFTNKSGILNQINGHHRRPRQYNTKKCNPCCSMYPLPVEFYVALCNQRFETASTRSRPRSVTQRALNNIHADGAQMSQKKRQINGVL